MPYTQENRICSVTTDLGKDALLLRRLSGHEGISQLFSFQLELLSTDDSIKFESLIGTNVTVSWQLSDGTEHFLNGLIARFSQGGADKRFVTYHIEMVPWLWLLTRRSDCRIFQDKTVPDIIKEVFDLLKLTDYELKLSGKYEKREYCVQYRETDFQFVSRLMEEEGIFYFFKHENGRHVLVLGDSSDVHDPCPGQSDAVYSGTTDKPEEVDYISDWRRQQVLHSGKFSLCDYNFETPNVDLLVNTASKVKVGGNNALELYDYHPGRYGTVSQGEGYTKIRIGEQEAGAVTIHGAGNCRSFVSGHQYTLHGHYRKDYDKKAYLLTSIEHSLAQASGYETGETVETVYENRFLCIPHATPFRPPRVTPKPHSTGIQTAVVVGPSGEEIHTDKHGRVKVLFHWDRSGKADETSSCWVRVSQGWAGKNWGTLFLPRIGQEVIVEFLEGDPDMPIITGCVYNGENKTPYTLPKAQTISTIKSDSSKGGKGFNEIRFEDKKDEEQIFLHAEKDLHLRAKNDRKEWIGNDRHLIVGKDKYEDVENNREETVQADHIEEIGKDRHLNVKGKEAKEVGKSLSLTVQGDVIEVFKKNHSEETTKDYYLKAKNVVIEGMQNITLSVGGSYIAIESGTIEINTSGQLKIDGSQVQVNGKQTSVNGTAMTEIKGGIVKIN